MNRKGIFSFWIKYFLITFIGLIIAGFFIKNLAERFVYNIVINKVPELTGINVNLKSVSIGFLQGKISFNEIILSDLSPLSQKPVVASVKKFLVDIGIISFLKGNFVFQRIVLYQPIINLGHQRSNEILSFLIGLAREETSREITKATYKHLIPFTIEKVIFKKGKLIFDDFSKEEHFLVIDNLDCSIENIGKYSKELPLKFGLKGEFPSLLKGSLACKGEFTSLIQKVNLTGEIKAKDIYLPYFNPLLGSDSNFSIKNGTLQLHANIRCQNNWLVSSNLVTLENLYISFEEGMVAKQKIFGLPVKIVTDFFKEDKISFNLPISGDIRDPQFGFTTAISQILLKAFKGRFKDSTARTLSAKMGRKIGEKIDKLFREVFHLKKEK